MSELSDRAINEIQNAVMPMILTDRDGNQYTSKAVYPVNPKEQPEPSTLKIATLTGLIDYVLSSGDSKIEPTPATVHIKSHCEVELLSSIYGPAKQRACLVLSSFADLLGKSFQFGTYYDQESFIVGLQSLFVPTSSRAQVLKIIGTIKENQVRESSDDGVTQAVSAKAGIALVTEVDVPNPVILQPYRTFREIDQPESPFILRVRQGREKPECALFEADGGRWKLEAIGRIKEFLEDKIELPIIA